MKQASWSRIRGQNSVNNALWEIVGRGKPTGSVLKEAITVSVTISISVEKVHHQFPLRILSCSRMSENHREQKVPEARAPVEECFDCPARITSMELAPIHSVKNEWHPPECLFCKSENGCRFGEKCSYAHRQVEEQPSKRSKRSKENGSGYAEKYTTISFRISGYGAAEVFIDFAEEFRHTETNPMCYIHKKHLYVMLTFETKIHRLE